LLLFADGMTMTFFAIVFDEHGNGIGAHAYAEAPEAYPAHQAPCTAEQAAEPAAWTRDGDALVEAPGAATARMRDAARLALAEAERVAVRCLALGLPFPAVWRVYAGDMAAIVNGTPAAAATLPSKPPMPAGV
jgi:hypothetical protein